MADKKITALTELSATGKAGEDFLHIIDYGGGSSPVNKKISLTNLFNNANVDTHIYGASKTLEVGFAAATNSHIKVATGANATTDGAVTINDDGVAYVDFVVKSLSSDQAIKVDAGTDKIIVNGDAANVDFTVSGDTQANLLHCDAGLDAIGIGTGTPDTAYYLDIAAVAGKSIKTAGSIDVTGSITCTADLTVTSRLFLNDAIATPLVGGVDVSNDVDIPLTDLVTHLLPNDNSTDFYALPNGTAAGQVKVIFNKHATLQATITVATLGHVGNTITLEAGETASMLYTTGGWIMLNFGGAVTQV